MYNYAPFLITSTAGGASRTLYGDLLTVGAHGKGYFFKHGWQHNLPIGPTSPMVLPYLFLCLLQRLNSFYGVAFGSQGRVHPYHAKPGCKA